MTQVYRVIHLDILVTWTAVPREKKKIPKWKGKCSITFEQVKLMRHWHDVEKLSGREVWKRAREEFKRPGLQYTYTMMILNRDCRVFQ